MHLCSGLVIQLDCKVISVISHLYTQYLVSISSVATAAMTAYLTGPQPTFSENARKT